MSVEIVPVIAGHQFNLMCAPVFGLDYESYVDYCASLHVNVLGSLGGIPAYVHPSGQNVYIASVVAAASLAAEEE